MILLLILILVFVIALPSIMNLLGLAWIISIFEQYKTVIFLGLFSVVFLKIYLNRATLLWKYFSRRTEKIIHRIIKREFASNPTVTPRQVFDEVVKAWVPLAKKLYPNVKPKELGIKLAVTPNGVKYRMFNLGLIKEEEFY